MLNALGGMIGKNPRHPLVSGFKSTNFNLKSKYFYLKGDITWPLQTPMTDRAPLFLEYTEDERSLGLGFRSLGLIYLDHSKKIPSYISKNTSEASLISANIKSSETAPPVGEFPH